MCLVERASTKNRLMLIGTKNLSFPLKISRSALTKSPPISFEIVCRATVEIYINAMMYICMSETPKHVCMSETSKRVCMYVSDS